LRFFSPSVLTVCVRVCFLFPFFFSFILQRVLLHCVGQEQPQVSLPGCPPACTALAADADPPVWLDRLC
jgi:hypothetical protein